jgi:hypothetical protein
MDKLIDLIIYHFMPLVTCYHLVTGNIFLNTAAQDAEGLEYAGNLALVPFQYVFAGRIAVPQEDPALPYEFQQRFDYNQHLAVKTASSIVALPFSFVIGSALKGLSYLSHDVRERHVQIAHAEKKPIIKSNEALYQSIGLHIRKEITEKITSLGCARRPGDENNLVDAKEGLRDICEIFEKHNIPFWVDCGTCLGAYRYGGAIPWDIDIDIAILQPDFANVKRILSTLDPEKYTVQDWSNRRRPETYLKVFIRKTHAYIDIYHFHADPQTQLITYINTNIDNMFMADSWKKSEQKYLVPTPYDVIFPLKYADFDGITVPVPNNIEKYLQLRYGDNLAPARIYDEATGQYEKDLSHPYWNIAYQ